METGVFSLQKHSRELLPENGRAFFAPLGSFWLVTRSSKLNGGKETHQLFLEGWKARVLANPASSWDELERAGAQGIPRGKPISVPQRQQRAGERLKQTFI